MQQITKSQPFFVSFSFDALMQHWKKTNVFSWI